MADETRITPESPPHTSPPRTSSFVGGGSASIDEKAKELPAQAVRAASDQKNVLGKAICDVAEALEHGADELDRKGNTSIAGYTRHIAQVAEDLGRSIERRELSDIFDDIRDFGRRQPVAMLGGAVLLGVVASRFFKSSPENGSAYESIREAEDIFDKSEPAVRLSEEHYASTSFPEGPRS